MLEYVRYLEKASQEPLKLKILDLIMLDTTTMCPYKWVYTDNHSYVQFRRLKDMSFSKIAQCFIENLPSFTSNPATQKEIACFGTDTYKRTFVTTTELLEYKEIPQVKFTSLQLFRNPIKSFEPFLYCVALNFHTAPEKKYWKTKIEKGIAGAEQPFCAVESKYKEKINEAVKVVVTAIEKASQRKVRSLKSLFVIHNNPHKCGSEIEAWLIGCENIVLDYLHASPVKILRPKIGAMLEGKVWLSMSKCNETADSNRRTRNCLEEPVKTQSVIEKLCVKSESFLKIYRRAQSSRRNQGHDTRRNPLINFISYGGGEHAFKRQSKTAINFHNRCKSAKGIYSGRATFSRNAKRLNAEIIKVVGVNRNISNPRAIPINRSRNNNFSSRKCKNFRTYTTFGDFKDTSLFNNKESNYQTFAEEKSHLKSRRQVNDRPEPGEYNMVCKGRTITTNSFGLRTAYKSFRQPREFSRDNMSISRTLRFASRQQMGAKGENKTTSEDLVAAEDSNEVLTKPVFNILVRKVQRSQTSVGNNDKSRREGLEYGIYNFTEL